MSDRIYVIDTNIILQNPHFLNNFENAIIVIPAIVLQELDNFKKDNELGKNAREFARILDKLYESDYKIEDRNIQVEIYFRDPLENVFFKLGGKTPDNIIIECANYFTNVAYQDTVLLSNDILVRSKARGLGINASGFTSDEVVYNQDNIYPGYIEYTLYVEYINTLYDDKFLSINLFNEIKIYPHMFIILNDFYGSKKALAKVNSNCTKVELVNPNLKPIWGILPRNAQQRMALQLLLDPDIQLVTLLGKAGSGKTLLSMAAGLVLTADEDFYNKVILTKPVVSMGKDIGYLPGNKEEKLTPWLQSYYDNLEVLMNGKTKDYDQLNLEIEALTYVRGRTLPNKYIIVDEAQNLTKHEVKSIITRVGNGSKIILLGDISQIDSPFLDSVNNGLTYVINKFKDQKIAGHVTFMKGERSELAEIAADIL